MPSWLALQTFVRRVHREAFRVELRDLIAEGTGRWEGEGGRGGEGERGDSGEEPGEHEAESGSHAGAPVWKEARVRRPRVAGDEVPTARAGGSTVLAAPEGVWGSSAAE